jgi:hypothetical protein
LFKLLPDKNAVIHISAINGDNRAILLGEQIFEQLLKCNYKNIRGVHQVFVPLIEGLEVKKEISGEYVVLIGLV